MSAAQDDPDAPLKLYLQVRDSQGGHGTLEGWMSWITNDIDATKAALADLERQVTKISMRLAALESAADEQRTSVNASVRESGVDGDVAAGDQIVAGELACADTTPVDRVDDQRAAVDDAGMRQRLDGLDRRLNDVLALFETHFGVGQTEQAMLHHNHAADYQTLVEQKVKGLAIEVLAGGIHAAARDKAEFVAAICRDLFEAEVPERQLIGRLPAGAPEPVVQRVRDIWVAARVLREDVAQGRPQRWQFGCRTGVPVDDEWQELWPGCARDAMVTFAVAPAYIVDTDTVLRKQLVFTIEAEPDDAAGKSR